MPAEFFVHNLGCKVNRVESDALCAALVAAGGRPVERERARVILINTCTVTGEAEAKARKAVRQALASASEPWVIATGCAIAVDAGSYRALGDRVIAEPDRLRAQTRALKLLGLTGAGINGERDGSEPIYEHGLPRDGCAVARNDGISPRLTTPVNFIDSSDGTRTRRGIKIQDGCDNACSYCIVRVARGSARSVPHDEVREQVRAAERDGIREVILTGVNVGSYHSDGIGLCQLVDTLLGATTELRVRLSSLEPQYASNEILTLMASSQGRLCAHLHLPLQSGCDRTLEAMARRYDSAFFAERVGYARGLMPQLALTTDLIVGFPGETDEDFAQSLAFCERMGFSRMHVFRYSCRPQTPAATMPGHIPPPISTERSRVARDLAARMRERDARARVGTREAVLVERRGRGTSESYHQVSVPLHHEAGCLLSLQITGYRDTLLHVTE
jgi:threonylcarbamoyladenosine tRNA methylthiotransferase MtaB